VQFVNCNAVPTNTLPLAYTMRRNERRWNAIMLRCILTEETYHFQEDEGRGNRRLKSLTRRYVKQYVIKMY